MSNPFGRIENDNGKGHVVLTVTMDRTTGNVQLKGPLTDKVLCLGMLSIAEHIIMTTQVEAPLVQPAVMLPRPPA